MIVTPGSPLKAGTGALHRTRTVASASEPIKRRIRSKHPTTTAATGGRSWLVLSVDSLRIERHIGPRIGREKLGKLAARDVRLMLDARSTAHEC